MPVLERLTAKDLAALMVGYRDALALHRETLNRLNVYPVPDGDTGNNMHRTLSGVVDGLDGVDEADLPAVCDAIARAALMSSAGNSGVIVCQVLRSMMAEFRSAPDGVVDVPTLVSGLRSASVAAYEAVGSPVEGTILTVVRETAEALAGADTDSMLSLLEEAKVVADTSLANTPNLLPKLAEAGVVDSGGAGFVLFVDAALSLLDGRPLPEPHVPELTAAELVGLGADHAAEHHDGDDHGDVGDLRYEVMYLLEGREADDEAITEFKQVWSTIGDSIVVVGGDGLWNCHIHTNQIGEAIEAALDVGRPRKIRVTDLFEEVEEERWVREAGVGPVELSREPVSTGLVVVCNGQGQERWFKEMKVQGIVSGGQTMNPSVGDLAAAVEAVNAPEVIILPNNSNIIAAAEQVDGLTDKRVLVLPTRSVQEGFIAAEHRDPEADADTNLEHMASMLEEVTYAEVTCAVRDSSSPVGTVKVGDWIGLSRSGISAIGPDAVSAACGVIDSLVTDDHGWLMILAGADATESGIRRIKDHVAEAHPHIEDVQVHHGGQPHYPYLFAIE